MVGHFLTKLPKYHLIFKKNVSLLVLFINNYELRIYKVTNELVNVLVHRGQGCCLNNL